MDFVRELLIFVSFFFADLYRAFDVRSTGCRPQERSSGRKYVVHSADEAWKQATGTLNREFPAVELVKYLNGILSPHQNH